MTHDHEIGMILLRPPHDFVRRIAYCDPGLDRSPVSACAFRQFPEDQLIVFSSVLQAALPATPVAGFLPAE